MIDGYSGKYRFCPSCNDVREFKYDFTIRHSRCIECAWNGSISEMTPIMIKEITRLKNIEKKFNIISCEKNKLDEIVLMKDKIKNLGAKIKELENTNKAYKTKLENQKTQLTRLTNRLAQLNAGILNTEIKYETLYKSEQDED